jgi:hypothetical protein
MLHPRTFCLGARDNAANIFDSLYVTNASYVLFVTIRLSFVQDKWAHKRQYSFRDIVAVFIYHVTTPAMT